MSVSPASRRQFLRIAGGASLAGLFPDWVVDACAAEADRRDMVIEAVDIIRVTGTMPRRQGVDRQYQAQPLHLYDPPAEYRDEANPRDGRETVTHDYVRIRTRGGLEGLYGAADADAAPSILGPLKTQLIGRSAMAVEYLWDRMYRSNRMSRAGLFMKGISYLDCALWDLRGQRLGVPVFELLGGPTRDHATCYASCLGYSVEPPRAASKAKELADAGFKHQKWFPAYGPAQGGGGMAKNIALVRELREAVGPDVKLMFDPYQAWDLQYATEWASAVEKYRPTWLEEAAPMADLESFLRLSKATRVPLATGEHFFNRWEVEQFLKARAIQYVQSDPEWCGGVSELVKMCHIASVHGAKVVPHGHNIHAALHVVLSQSPAVCPLVEYLLVHMPHKTWLQKDPPLTTDSTLPLPTRPGFGIEIDDAKVEKRETLERA